MPASLAERLYTATWTDAAIGREAWTTLDELHIEQWERVAEVAKVHIVTPLLVQLMILGVPADVIEQAIDAAGLRRAP